MRDVVWAMGGVVVGGAIVLMGMRVWRRRQVNGNATFRPKPILNRPEAKLYRIIEHLLPHGYRLMAQVSYGEMMKSSNLTKYHQINARRADIVIVDKGFNVVAVIEYRGAGHRGYNINAANYARRGDRVKRISAQEAGLRYIEIPKNFTTATVREVLLTIFPPDPDDDIANGSDASDTPVRSLEKKS